MMIKKVETREEFLRCTDVLLALRPHLQGKDSYALFEKMQQQSYRLWCIEHDNRAVACIGFRFMTFFLAAARCISTTSRHYPNTEVKDTRARCYRALLHGRENRALRLLRWILDTNATMHTVCISTTVFFWHRTTFSYNCSADSTCVAGVYFTN